jgi:hypothetical protein
MISYSLVGLFYLLAVGVGICTGVALERYRIARREQRGHLTFITKI